MHHQPTVVFGCIPPLDVPSSKLTIDFYDFKKTPDQKTQFKNYSLDEQYQLLIYGNQVKYPPDLRLVEWFAEEGPRIIPFLSAKLNATQNEKTICNIMHVFSDIALSERYDFSNDQELLALLDQKAQNMGLRKHIALTMITQIRTGKFVFLPQQELEYLSKKKEHPDSSQ